MDDKSHLNSSDPKVIEDYYQKYLEDKSSLNSEWRQFFDGFEFARNNYPIKQTLSADINMDKEFAVINLIEAYRKRGHLFTETNPVRTRRQYFPRLDIENYQLSEKDLQTVFQAGKRIGIGPASLQEITDHLKQTYCRSIGAEFMFIRNTSMVDWLEQKMESVKNTPRYSNDEKKHFYHHLNLAVGFEKYIHKKFIGQKRFSLEGAEALIPALDAIIEKGAGLGIKEFIIGMAHRGRLNVLANILKKPYKDIFKEFVGLEYDESISLGDVKYHLGYGNDIETDQGKQVRLNLAPNPSHLEAVGPVVAGIARAKTDKKYDGDENKLAPILIHGDAAIASQGVVYELLQMSQLPGYKNGGTIHLVINNQVGFTTNYLDARSSTYCTDIAKVTKAPIFHVNGDDVEALIYTIQLAMEFRQAFHHDVFIDILCYRKYGHNEGDEPRFTQPLLYKIIEKHPNPRDIFGQKLIDQKICTKEDIKRVNDEFEDELDKAFAHAKDEEPLHIKQFLSEDWQGFRHPLLNESEVPDTRICKEELFSLANQINHLPEDKKFFKKITRLVESRKKSIDDNALDWAMGELLAYASLLKDKTNIRISGQDSIRGTFSHRHAGFVQEDNGEFYFPLQNLEGEQANFSIFNSPLSEYAVMGFEYGYALATPGTLTIWEAQFGDFSNTAQVIIDQFISSGEEKWGLMNGLVLLLPHGYEGQGPEHSSARMERFLSLSVNNNMHVVYPSTPANYFHLLRQHILTDCRIPMIVFTPKSLLRHPACVSKIEDFSDQKFRPVLDDPNTDPENVKRLVFCTGKIFYDLLKKKEEYDARDIALVRIEQLHPFPEKEIDEILEKYPNALLHLWVQEEPENMGAWPYIQKHFKKVEILPICRQGSGSPAVGLIELHKKEQDIIIGKVFRKCTCELKNKYCGLQCAEGSSREEIKKQFYYFSE